MIQADMKEVYAHINARLAYLKATGPVLQLAGQVGVRSVQERIANTKVGPAGKRWKGWSPLTAAKRAQRGTASGGLLLDSGALLKSIKATQIGDTVVIEPGVGYAKHLQSGTTKMPARPFMGWNAKTTREVGAVFKAWANGGSL